MLSLAAASASSFSLGRAVAPTLTPAAASRFATSPQIAPEAPVIHATFQGNFVRHCSLSLLRQFQTTVIPAKAGLQ